MAFHVPPPTPEEGKANAARVRERGRQFAHQQTIAHDITFLVSSAFRLARRAARRVFRRGGGRAR